MRSLAVALVMAAAVTGCGDSDKDSVGTTPTPTSTQPGTSACEPSGTGTTDLTKKPVVTVHKTPAPAQTTVVDIVCGTGAQANEGSNVEVKYLGALYSDGSEFDSSWSRGDTLPFTICSRIITGFCAGTTGMKVGGRREVIVSPEDGYGAAGSPPKIPANATLIFIIDLVSVS